MPVYITYIHGTDGMTDFITVKPVDFADENDEALMMDIAAEAVKGKRHVSTETYHRCNVESHLQIKLPSPLFSKRIRGAVTKAIKEALAREGYREIVEEERSLREAFSTEGAR